MTDHAYAEPDAPSAPKITGRLRKFATASGDISKLLDDGELTTLGVHAVRDWERDDADRATWKTAVTAALALAAQDPPDAKLYPWVNASNVQYPILTVASQQFAARAYPAIVKGDEAVGVKVLGDDPTPPNSPPQPPGSPPDPQMQAFQQAVGLRAAKKARAKRVKDWLNYRLFYGMDDWEGDVDVLLNQLPIIGMAFKKVYFDPHKGVRSDYVSALKLCVPMDTQSLERAPRVTQEFELYPYEIHARIAAKTYRDVRDALNDASDEDEQKPRCIIEQHRLVDLDDDGIEEPYILTVDVESQQVLRIEAAFTLDDIARSKTDNKVTHIRRWMPYVAFLFLPDPKGRFYGMGFGLLLKPLTAIINTLINELIDAGNAANAGGGFIASGLRLQGAGQTSTLRFQPGEFKTVNAQGQDLRNMVWERTIPTASPVLFQMLDLVLGAAKDISSIKDVLTGEAPSTAPVGTTMALIEQGLQSFTAIYKRTYRSLKAEYKLIYECEGRWGGEDQAAEYAELLDDPAADFAADFSPKGNDIVPVSDPTVVTRAQALAKAQVIQQTAAAFPGAINPQAAAKRTLEAAEIENVQELLSEPQPPPPQMLADVDKTKSETTLNLAKAKEAEASAGQKAADAQVKTGEAHAQGAQDAAYQLGTAHEGGLADVGGEPGQPMGVPGAPDGGGGPADGMGQPDLGAGPVGGAGPPGSDAPVGA